jgi:hypothetical protein
MKVIVAKWPEDLELFVFFEHAEGYVKVLEKSTSSLSTMREIFGYGA